MMGNDEYTNNFNIKCRSFILSNVLCKISRKKDKKENGLEKR